MLIVTDKQHFDNNRTEISINNSNKLNDSQTQK